MKNENFYFLLFWVGITIAALLVTLILRPITKYFENFLIDYQAAKRIIQQRKSGASPNDVSQFRRSDNMENLSRNDRAMYKRGEELLQQGQLIPAANIFESIGFSRKAIDILEGAGLIDEACAVLVRMKSIGRAGVIYERNKMFEKAAYCYSEAQQHENAGKVFLKLAPKDFRYFNSAADSFAKSGSWDAYIHAVGEVLDTQHVIEAATAHGRMELLANYLSHSEIAQQALEKINREIVTKMFGSIALSPKMVLYARGWVALTSTYDLEILNFVHRDRDLCGFFWAGLSEQTRHRLSLIVTSTGGLSDDARNHHLPHVTQVAAS